MYRIILIGIAVTAIAACGDDSVNPTEEHRQARRVFVPVDATERVQLPDSGIYEGDYQNGLMHGEGKLVWRNGTVYEGEFKQGLMHGKGKMTSANGDIYEGEFVNGMAEGKGKGTYSHDGRYKGEFRADMFHGQGKYTSHDGTVYKGEFKSGRLNGKGKIIYPSSGTYEGDVKDWRMHGQGKYTTRNGNVTYSGEFADDKQSGLGEILHKGGSYYKGEIKDWTAHGKGELLTKNGERYKGGFNNGEYDGEGELTYVNGNRHKGTFKNGMRHGKGVFTRAKPMGRKKVELGWWEYDEYVGKEKPKTTRTLFRKEKRRRVDAESIYYSQPQKLQHALKKIRVSEKNKVDMYVLNFAGYGSQDVFMKEALFSSNLFDEHFGTRGRSLNLINNHKLVKNTPLASVTNLTMALQHMAKVMDKDEDILFMYLTSHGTKKHRLNVSLRGVPLNDLSAKKLAQLIKQSGIKWKVIVVSSCYSGGFIKELKDDTTMVMTSAKADHVSFGCSDEAEFTYFGRALLKHALPDTSSFTQAFGKAQALVEKWEDEEKYDHSGPQLWAGRKIKQQLKKWRMSLSNKLALQ